MTKPALTLAAVAATTLSAIALTACGGSSTAAVTPATTSPAATAPATTAPDNDAPATTAPAAPGVQKETSTGSPSVGITLGKPSEFSLVAAPAKVGAGKVTFQVRNVGKVTHELVVVKTDKAQGALASGGGRADETGSLGESGDLKAGASTKLTLTLPKGHYVLLCNLPGHYAGGMHAAFTVK